MKQRLKTEFRDALELFVLPGLAAVLPWSWCFSVFKRLAHWDWLYRNACQSALIQARQLGWAGADEAHWLWVRKLITLVDHADHYLGLSRRDSWMQKHLAVQGDWPSSHQAQMLLTFHWGAGYWSLRHAVAHGLQPHALIANAGQQVYAGRTVLGWYAKARNANVARTLGAINFDVSKDLKSVIHAVRNGQSLLGLVDVPADLAKAAVDVTILGMRASVPRGLLRLAVDQQIPVTVYITSLDVMTGRRFLRIKNLGTSKDFDSLTNQVFAELETIIENDPPAWHLWAISDRFFSVQAK